MTCMAFAVSLMARSRRVVDCPELRAEAFANSRVKLQSMFPEGETVEKTGVIIHSEKCIGCGDCVTVCNQALTTLTMAGAIGKRDEVPPVLKVINGVVEIINWQSCKRCMDPPEACTVCESKCLFDALEIVPLIDAEDE
jgi:4Fe-4S ferredoxin